MPNPECRTPSEDARHSFGIRHSAFGISRFPLAYLASQFPLRSETFVWREVRELRRRGWTVHTFGLRPPAEVSDELADLRASTRDVYSATARLPLSDGVAAHARVSATAFDDALRPGEPLGPRGRLALVAQARAGLRLVNLLRGLGVRHVHAHFAHAPASVAMYAAAYLGIPFSFTGHANDLFQRRQLLRRKLERAAFVACISAWHRDLYRSIAPRGDDAYRIVRCGVDVDGYPPRTRRGPQDAPHVVSVCRLVEKKGMDVLIHAIARLNRESRRVRLTIAGDGPLRAGLVTLARSSGVADAVCFAGAVDSAGVRSLLAGADVFALPCRVDANGDQDGIPVALMEAMACGVPVVAGDLPAIRELVTDGATGLLADGRDVESVARAIVSLVDDADTSWRLGMAGRERVAGEFSLAANVDRLEAGFRAGGVRAR